MKISIAYVRHTESIRMGHCKGSNKTHNTCTNEHTFAVSISLYVFVYFSREHRIENTLPEVGTKIRIYTFVCIIAMTVYLCVRYSHCCCYLCLLWLLLLLLLFFLLLLYFSHFHLFISFLSIFVCSTFVRTFIRSFVRSFVGRFFLLFLAVLPASPVRFLLHFYFFDSPFVHFNCTNGIYVSFSQPPFTYMYAAAAAAVAAACMYGVLYVCMERTNVCE